jgi:hypothetical protein
MRVSIKTRIDKLTDKSSSRYALDSVQAVPGTVPDDCFLAATNSKSAIIIRQEGEVDETCLIPSECLPSNQQTVGIVVSKDGKEFIGTASTRTGDITKKGEASGHIFPRIQEVFPNVDLTDGWIGLCIDPKEILSWCEAAGRVHTDGGLKLMIKLPKERGEGKPVYWVEAPVAVHLQSDDRQAVGVIMPCGGVDADKSAATKFNQIVNDYRTAVTRQDEEKKDKKDADAETPVVKVTEEVAEAFDMKDLPNTEVVSVPADVVDGFNIPMLIQIAADSIDELRRCDVYRVISTAPERVRAEVAEYINFHRQDLVDKVAEALRWCAEEATQQEEVEPDNEHDDPEFDTDDAVAMLSQLLAAV